MTIIRLLLSFLFIIIDYIKQSWDLSIRVRLVYYTLKIIANVVKI